MIPFKPVKFLNLFVLTILIAGVGCQLTEDPKNKVIIDGYISPNFSGNTPKDASKLHDIRLQYAPLHHLEDESIHVIEDTIASGKKRWEILTKEDLLFNPQTNLTFIIHPGDSLFINYEKDKISYSGRQADSMKFQFINKLNRLNGSFIPPTKNSFTINTLDDYFTWDRFLDNKLATQVKLIDSFKNTISGPEYEYYRTDIISNAENDRVNAFSGLCASMAKNKIPDLSASDLTTIWDTTQYKPFAKWLRSYTSYIGSIQYMYFFNKMAIQRKFNFDFTNDSLQSKEKRTYLYYQNAKQDYSGLLRERLLVYILDEQTITEMGLKDSVTQVLLKDYYSQPGFPEYKQVVKELEAQAKKLAKNE